MNYIPLFFHLVAGLIARPSFTFPSVPLNISTKYFNTIFYKINEKNPQIDGRAIFIIYLTFVYAPKYQRNPSEMTKSTNTKKIANNITVVITTIVYFVSSLLFGQLVFLISDMTSCRNFFTLPILA